MTTANYIAKRTAVTVILIFFAVTALFVLFRSLPGSYIDYMVASGANPDEIEILKQRWGLDDPIHIQYINYLQNMFTGDMGQSFRYRAPVVDVVGKAIRNSFILVAPAVTTAYLLGSLIGGVMGTKRGSKLERYGIVPLTFIGTIPEFFTGILLIIIFAFWLNMFPTGGMTSIMVTDDSLIGMFQTVDFWKHYFLPYLTIIIQMLYYPSLLMRTNVVEVSGQDFMYYHRMKGIPQWKQLKHTMKHASLPVITLYPISMARAVGGVVVIELVFNWPGIGPLLLQSVFSRDFPVVQFVFFLVAVWIILGNYVVDLLYSVIDPRVALEGEST